MPEPIGAAADSTISFGPFRLLPQKRLLLEGDRPVHLGGRALDILIALVERPGELISKQDLIARVWPETFVDESNLRVHIAALRKALGHGPAADRYVVTDAGRGYRFVAPVMHSSPPETLPDIDRAASGSELPPIVTRMIGRSDFVEMLIRQLQLWRLVTIAGPGGIGKTTVALAVAERLAANYADRCRFVDLAPVADPALVAAKLAAALGTVVQSGDPVSGVVASLRDREMLIVLDTCEHVVEAAANLAAAILRHAPGIRILATSREPLRADGEHVLRLPSLDVPPAAAGMSAAEALRFPAVQLFVERAAAAADTFELNDTIAPAVVEICRRLDGIALAIELAAGRVDVFGVARLALLLEDRFRFLVRGRRTALPRHRTLSATLDWSYGTLTPAEQEVLRRLAVFVGNFDLDAAAVVVEQAGSSADVLDSIANLIAKSLVATDLGGGIASYRLLDSTRAYALEKLRESGQFREVARRHAEYYRSFVERAESEWETRPRAGWLQDFRRHLDNIRVALDWAFSADGDQSVGIAFAAAAVRMWTHLSLVDEGILRIGRALGGLDRGSDFALRLEMRLRAGLGLLLMDTRGSAEETRAAWARVFEIAEELHDDEYGLRARFGLWVYYFNSGQLRKALESALQSSALARDSTDAAAIHVNDEQVGLSLYALGDLTGARRHIEAMLAGYQDSFRRRDDGRLVHDQRSSAHNFLARVLWLQGFPDQAMAMWQSNVANPGTHENAVSLGNALVHGLPIAFWVGDLATAERMIAMLRDTAVKHALVPWQMWCRGFEARLLIERGDIDGGLNRLAEVIEELRGLAFKVYYVAFLAAYAEALARAGRLGGSLASIDEALAITERTEEKWCLAELLRIKGVALSQNGVVDAAEEHFERSLAVARQQQALSWELRTAISLARLLHGAGRSALARDTLGAVSARFTEGFGTADFIAARALLTVFDAGPTPPQ